ncbi:hypothetical conserved protein (plasmid) [Rhizobium etli CFN 42]|uniref:Hypothetical conserved protein n=1 Tax=Rhizobium etli (strain ATCC 51251 / DSM 11541 / JCM 21823 / NBRC 15573 / CFN 42) TaxID=347834 RepID=Q2JZT6_RHIEC|nr:hypothetical conserved protein [Rhizobium etli CFN 42]
MWTGVPCGCHTAPYPLYPEVRKRSLEEHAETRLRLSWTLGRQCGESPRLPAHPRARNRRLGNPPCTYATRATLLQDAFPLTRYNTERRERQQIGIIGRHRLRHLGMAHAVAVGKNAHTVDHEELRLIQAGPQRARHGDGLVHSLKMQRLLRNDTHQLVGWRGGHVAAGSGPGHQYEFVDKVAVLVDRQDEARQVDRMSLIMPGKCFALRSADRLARQRHCRLGLIGRPQSAPENGPRCSEGVAKRPCETECQHRARQEKRSQLHHRISPGRLRPPATAARMLLPIRLARPSAELPMPSRRRMLAEQLGGDRRQRGGLRKPGGPETICERL